MHLPTCLAALALAGGVAAAPATAAVTHFDLGFTNPVATSGNSATFTVTKDGETLNVTVTAVQLFNGRFRAADALPIYSYAGRGVLGAISPNDQGGQQNWHQVDNADGTEFLVFQFDRAVTLDSISREGVAIGPDRAATWSNAAIGSANIDPAGFRLDDLSGLLGGLTTVQGLKAEGRNRDGSDVTTFDTDALDFTTAGNLWLVGADQDTSIASAFKLASLGVDWDPAPPSVPEPASWAMLLIGFGLVGAAFRRGAGRAQSVTA